MQKLEPNISFHMLGGYFLPYNVVTKPRQSQSIIKHILLLLPTHQKESSILIMGQDIPTIEKNIGHFGVIYVKYLDSLKLLK